MTFLKREKTFLVLETSKFWDFLRLSRKVVKGSGQIVAYSCSNRQDGNFDVAHDMIWIIIFKNLLNYNRVLKLPYYN